MSVSTAGRDAAGLMDAIYRHQRHIYDASRKFYLLGRDQLIAGLAPPEGGSVLEIGCGTGRNLIAIARRYPGRACHGLGRLRRDAGDGGGQRGEGRARPRYQAGPGGCHRFRSAGRCFGRAGFDRIVISYALSMIPPWREVARQAMTILPPGGELHIVDFGDQHGLPAPFRAILNRWLALFHVTPRHDLAAVLNLLAQQAGIRAQTRSLYRGYATLAVVKRLPKS